MEKNDITYSDLGKERIITVADLLREIGRRFWIVVVLMVIFAVLLGGYKYYRDSRSAQKSESSTEVVVENGSLSQEEAEAVDNVMVAKANMDEQQNYVNNSVLMQIDPFNESTVILQYHVEVPDNEDAEMYSQDLMKSYEGYINNGALAAGLVDEGYPLEVQYLGELLSYSVETESGSEEDLSLYGLTGAASTTFDLKIIQVDEESAQELADLIVKDLESYTDVLNDSVGEHSLVLVDQTYSRVVDSPLRTYKYDRVNNINTMAEKIEEMEADFSSTQLEYLQQREEQKETASTGTENETIESASASVHISRRYVILGIVIGFILACVYIILAYVLRGRINTSNDIRYMYNLRVLGELRTAYGKGGKAIRKRHVRIPPEKQLDLLVANLKDACHENGVQKILIGGSGKLEADQELAQNLKEALKAYGIQAEYVADLPYSVDAVDLMTTYKAVVLLETIRHSDYRTMEDEIRTCMEHEASILGVVVSC